MAGDIEALKKGSVPSHSEIKIDPAIVPQNNNIKLSFPKLEPLKQEEKPTIKPISMGTANPKEEIPKPIITPPVYKPLVSPPPLSPKQPQPFENPIKKPIMPPENLNQQRVQAPPLGLPTEPSTPPRPTTTPMRPLTPPPIYQQAPKLPPLPPLPVSRPNLPPLPPIPSRQAIQMPSLPSRGGKSKLILIGIVSVLILSFVAGEIWWFFLRQTPATEQATTQDILPPPQELQPLLPVEEAPAITDTSTETVIPAVPAGLLSYNQSEQIVSVANIKTLNSDSVAENAFVRLMVEQSIVDKTTSEASTSEITTIDELLTALKIKIPASVKKELSEEFDVFAFGGNTFDKTECEKIKNTSPSCYGPRLGLALKVLDSAKMNPLLKTWEKTMVTDLKPMILAKVGSSASTIFQSGIYQDQTIRYKNLPLNTITVEYALVGNVLIITTSKSAVLKAIDSVNVSNP